MSQSPGIRYFPCPSTMVAPVGIATVALLPISTMCPSATTTVMSGFSGAPVASITFTCAKTSAGAGVCASAPKQPSRAMVVAMNLRNIGNSRRLQSGAGCYTPPTMFYRETLSALTGALLLTCAGSVASAGVAGTPGAASSHRHSADVILTGGHILTEDPRDSVVEALAIRDGRVIALGTNARILQLAGAA